MIESHAFAPALLTMTLTTVLTLAATMHIVGLVTGVTFCVYAHFRKFRAVTIVAGKLLVLAQQPVTGVPRMLKQAGCPGFFRMATLAFVAVLPLVMIVLLMTAITIRLQFLLERTALMTGNA